VATSVRYSPPLLISTTSTADWYTTWPWAAGMFDLTRTTDGHDASLFTHSFKVVQPLVATCRAKPGPDFGQNWHCLRMPEPPDSATPRIGIDLPTRERVNRELDVPHARYSLEPIGNTNSAHLAWVFQTPPALIADHNDIFNSRAMSLILAFLQMSGGVASLARDWEDTFDRAGP
jgi:hypothetical protein